MTILFLAFSFLGILALLILRRPLWQALLGGILLLALLFRIPAGTALRLTLATVSSWGSLSVVLVVYCITFLQRMLEKRGMLRGAQQDLDALFHNRRVNASGAPIFIGLLPSAAAMILCADIVRDATKDSLTPPEQAFTASWFRHIPECILPTYTGVILTMNLTGVAPGAYMLSMLPPVFALALLGFVFTLRRVPRDTGTRAAGGRGRAMGLFFHLWPLLLILVLILFFGMDTCLAVFVSILASALLLRFSASELRPMFKSALEPRILLSTWLVLVFKEFIAETGALLALPRAMAALPLPAWLIFAILLFLATLVGGQNSAIALGAPLACAVLPGGVPLAVFLTGITHAACQVSPVHVCLTVAAESFHISLGQLIRKTLPAALIFCAFTAVYYHLLLMVLR